MVLLTIRLLTLIIVLRISNTLLPKLIVYLGSFTGTNQFR